MNDNVLIGGLDIVTSGCKIALYDADGNFVDEHALTAAISRVRNKIETPDRQYIKTVYGMGYMWIGGALK